MTILLRPIHFVDSPVGLPDGTWARLANTLLWYQGVEVRRPGQPVEHVPVAALGDFLTRLPDDQRARADAQLAGLAAHRPVLTLGKRTIRFDVPQVMGILNMTPDSFSDGGKHLDDVEAAADAGFAMGLAGATIIDVGGESTRPGADPVWEGDEIRRVVPVIERLARSGAIISIDTRKAAVMEAALAAGAHIVNDISALLHEPRSLDVVAAAGCPVVVMHSPSTGQNPHERATPYGDVVAETYAFLEERVAACIAAGIARDRIMVDPGIGFGKSLADNMALLNRLATFQSLGLPLLLGASRKRIVGALSNEAPADQRLGGSLTLALEGVRAGVAVLRVHDVAESVQSVRVWRGLRDAALSVVG
ncbi:dihydropteroate synthase [Sphingobium sufflavum]|uniref:dihydropteroate synthase n=1 Tax=Sphingobium sufflavum TaxID=1129547 RepID=UPI001F369AE7|nr:dihydropteroate synthase [Sphingobium sufflavum]MCE7797559.1 dihydropteroate synthase [Sphingobium sufflavum]